MTYLREDRALTRSIDEIGKLSRAERQAEVADWCEAAFGRDSLMDRHKRALRLLEEALELFQAERGDPGQAAALAARVFSRPAGEPLLEAGGVAVTFLSWCAAAGASADACEAAEIARVLAKPFDDLRARYLAKTRAGF